MQDAPAERHGEGMINRELWYPISGEQGEEAHRKPLENLEAAVTQMQALRPFPAAVQKLLSQVAVDDFKLEDVIRTIESDPTLAARVLAVVNSPGFGVRMPCRKIGAAVTLLGVRKLVEVTTAAAALDRFDDRSPASRLITAHSLSTAAVCRQLAVRCNLPSDELFTCGLLHDLGKLIFLQLKGETYAAFALENGKAANCMHEPEREMYGFDHAILAGVALERWRIPAPVPLIVAWHHQAERAAEAGGELSRMISVVKLADRMCHDFAKITRVEMSWIIEIAKDADAKALQITERGFSDLCRQLYRAHVESKQRRVA